VGLVNEIVKEHRDLIAGALSNAAALGWRNERARVAARKDRRWKRLEVVVTRGRSMAASSVAYGQLAADIYGDLAKQAGNAAGGYMEFLGYARERLSTVYPDNYRFNAGPSGQFGPGMAQIYAERTSRAEAFLPAPAQASWTAWAPARAGGISEGLSPAKAPNMKPFWD
jgi:hypothetical protein